MIATPSGIGLGRGAGASLPLVWLVVLAAASGCAADPGERLPDGGATPDAVPDAVAEVAADRPTDVPTDGYAPGPDGPWQVEPPLVVRACDAGGSGGTCCPSALGFEDGTTEHFLPAACCRMALSSPQLAAMPTACGHGALRLEADFRAAEPSSMCGTPDETLACAYTAGEVSRAILAPLNLAGRTASVMTYLQGPALPAGPVHGRLFVVGKAGLIEGPEGAISRTDAWTAIEVALPDDGSGAGTDIQVLGIRLDFHGQAWAGRVFLDELTWR